MDGQAQNSCHNLEKVTQQTYVLRIKETISSPEFSGSSVSGGLPGRTLGTRNFYCRNRAVPVLVCMLGFDENRSHHEVNFSRNFSLFQALYDRERWCSC